MPGPAAWKVDPTSSVVLQRSPAWGGVQSLASRRPEWYSAGFRSSRGVAGRFPPDLPAVLQADEWERSLGSRARTRPRPHAESPPALSQLVCPNESAYLQLHSIAFK